MHAERFPDYLEDLVIACNRIHSFIGQKSKRNFLSSRLMQSAILREIEVTGEVAKRIRDIAPDFLARYPQLALEGAIGIRNRISHVYEGVDLDLVWKAATVSVPQLRAAAADLLLQIRPDSNLDLLDY